MSADPLQGQVGEVWALEISIFWGPKCHSPNNSMPFYRVQKSLDFQGPNAIPLSLVMDLHASKTLHTGPYKS